MDILIYSGRFASKAMGKKSRLKEIPSSDCILDSLHDDDVGVVVAEVHGRHWDIETLALKQVFLRIVQFLLMSALHSASFDKRSAFCPLPTLIRALHSALCLS